MAIFARDLGIDLGTANIIVYAKGKGIVLREPSVVAVSKKEDNEVMAVGEDARNMLGRTPEDIIAVQPMHDGVIADYDITLIMLEYFIKKATGSRFSLIKPRVVMSVPCGITPVERRAVNEATRSAGARYVHLLEEPMAAAIGAGLPVINPSGSMIIDIGGGTFEVAVLSMGDIVAWRSVRMAGNKMDEAIVNFIKREHNLLIGDRTAEEVKLDIGSAMPLSDDMNIRIAVRGRDLVTGLPQTIEITSSQVAQALYEPISIIIDAIKSTLEDTPPELVSDIMERGIYLSGGGALLVGIDQLIANETGIPVVMANNPMDCVALGLGKLVEDEEYLSRVSHGAIGDF